MVNRVFFTDYFEMNTARYSLLFSYENIYGLFRLNENSGYEDGFTDSRNYKLIAYDIHGENSESEVLTDICVGILSGEINMQINDVICIKDNGCMYSYKYVNKIMSFTDKERAFIPIKNFLTKEIEDYLSRIHKNNSVLEVLKGEIISIADPILEKSRAYCIELEEFKQESSIFSINYSLFGLFGKEIQNVCPGRLPFISIKNALYYYRRKKISNSLLLFDKTELEMIKAYFMLRKAT